MKRPYNPGFRGARVIYTRGFLSDQHEEFIDTAYTAILAISDLMINKGKAGLQAVMMNNSAGKTTKDFDALVPLIDGLYIPGSQRAYWAGHFDVDVDPLPDRGCVAQFIEHDKGPNVYNYTVVYRVPRVPQQYFGKKDAAIAAYKVMHVDIVYQNDRTPKNIVRDRSIVVTTGYLTITADGAIRPTIDAHRFGNLQATGELFEGFLMGSAALSLLADRRYLWNVQTSETFESATHRRDKAVVNFGIEPDMIQSLLYARSLPLTVTGRRKPILHWVRSHKRRIKEGIEIDVCKHLRGTQDLVMGDMAFRISEPDKAIEKAKRLKERANEYHR